MKARAKRITEFNEAVGREIKKVTKPPRLGDLTGNEEKVVQKLYQQSVERKKITLKKLEDKFVPKPPAGKVMQAEEIDTMAERLHSQSRAHRDQMMERLTVKVYGKPGAGTRKLAASEMTESVARQYQGALEKKKEKMLKLEAMHRFQPASKTIATEEVAAMADRLSKREPRT
jgi:hypothetical protein